MLLGREARLLGCFNPFVFLLVNSFVFINSNTKLMKTYLQGPSEILGAIENLIKIYRKFLGFIIFLKKFGTITQ